MADGGELAAAFRALAGDAAQAGEDVGNSMGRFFEDTADIEDENVNRTLAADAENARALNAIRSDPGNLESGGGGEGNRIAGLLDGSGTGGSAAGAGSEFTAEDAAALHDYTTNDGYKTMNPYLRNPDGYCPAIRQRSRRGPAGVYCAGEATAAAGHDLSRREPSRQHRAELPAGLGGDREGVHQH